jgi:dipeptide/tripeptide permease
MAAATTDLGKTPSAAPPPEAEPKLGFFATMKTFPRPFWMGCVIEMWERLAWYGTRVVLPIYICQADEPGGLHFTQAEKGTIYAWWALLQGLLPTLTGGIADRYGYKKTIAAYATINITAFVLMANMRTYNGFFAACLLLGVGTALFKPALQGTLAQSMSKKNSSVGWGFFYWLVNVGGLIGPGFANTLRPMGWSYVFYGCAAVTSLNYLMLFTYPPVESGADKTRSITKTLVDTFKNLFDLRLVAVIAIFTGFWMTLYQLWDFMPNFFTDWTDSSSFAKTFSWLPKSFFHETARGTQLKQEWALNVNSLFIVLFVVLMSYLVRKMRVLTAMTIGVLIATAGTFIYGTSPSVYVVFLGIALFSLGEMLTGPKKTEYFSLIAPEGKKALYLGYVNIPVALGQALGAVISSRFYGANGEKATLALRYLAEKTDRHAPGTWDGDLKTLEAFVGVGRKESVKTLVNVLGQDATQVNQLLWDTYKPYTIWYVFTGVALCSLIGMIVYSQLSKRWKEMNV